MNMGIGKRANLARGLAAIVEVLEFEGFHNYEPRGPMRVRPGGNKSPRVVDVYAGVHRPATLRPSEDLRLQIYNDAAGLIWAYNVRAGEHLQIGTVYELRDYLDSYRGETTSSAGFVHEKRP